MSVEDNLRSVGSLIEIFDCRNSDGHDYPFYGINKDKSFMPTVADTNNLDNTKYKVVSKGDFVFSGMQTGRDVCIRIALFDKDEPVIISPAYTTFRVKDCAEVIPQYLFIQFNRFEMDRYGWFLSDGSIRSNLDWDRFCEIEIPLPDITVQQELVDTYNGLKALAEQNEALIEPLSKACEAFIVDCKTKYPEVELGKFMIRGEKNSTKTISKVLGVAQSGFITPQKDPNESLANYKIMRYKAICYAPPLYNIKSDAIQIYEYEEPAVCSPIYEVFYVDEKYILPHYLFIKLKRQEFKRYAEYYALGVRQTFNYELMEQVKIPLPPIEIQQSIVNLYNCLEEAKKIASEAREKLKTLCPALVQRAANS